MIDFGVVRPGTELYVPFATYDSNAASTTIADFAVEDIKVYKNGGTTPRNSNSGYTLLGTDGVDEYGTGVHGFTVNLSDNSESGFYGAGSQYWVIVGPITVDGKVVRFIAATFRIGYAEAFLNTTIASLASQTSFTLTTGPADDHALVSCVALIHSVASPVQTAIGVVSEYVGSTRTVTLAADPNIFTIAEGDNISFSPQVNTRWLGAGLSVVTSDATPEVIASAVSDHIVEGTLSLNDAVKLILAVAAGKLSGAEGASVVIRDTTDTYNRITTTVDQYGNRSAVSYVTT